MKEIAIGVCLVLAVQMIRPRSYTVEGGGGIALFLLGCYGAGYLITMAFRAMGGVCP